MFDKILTAILLNNLLGQRRSEEKFFITGVTQGNLELPLSRNSLDLHLRQKQQNEILDSTCVLISLSNNQEQKYKELIYYVDKAKKSD